MELIVLWIHLFSQTDQNGKWLRERSELFELLFQWNDSPTLDRPIAKKLLFQSQSSQGATHLPLAAKLVCCTLLFVKWFLYTKQLVFG